MMYVWLVVGFILLIKGADFFVDGSASVAKKLRVPAVIIGLTIVAMGTSAPEAAVSVTAGLNGDTSLSLGNVIGSNLFNLLMVIGCSAIMKPVESQPIIIKRDIPWNIVISVVLFGLILTGGISRVEGVLLLLGIVLYIAVVVRSALNNREEGEEITSLPLWKCIIFIAGGILAIILGGNLVVDNAKLIASAFGMSDTLIGLTIVAIGTSLPELVTSVVAARKGESGIALGNAVGSCIFNVLFILGIAATLSPIRVNYELLADTGLLILVNVMIYLCARTGRKTNRAEGIFYVICYVLYTVYIILR